MSFRNDSDGVGGQPSREAERVKIGVNELTIGMYVAELDRPWLETPFMFQGFVVSNEEDLRTIRELCEYVYVDVVKETFEARRQNAAGGKDKKRPPLAERLKWVKEVPFEQEVTKAKGSFDDARKMASDVLAGMRLGAELDTEKIKKVVSECVDSILRNEDALLWLMQIKNRDNYTAEHSMNVGMMSAAFGKHLGHPRFEIEQLGLCGMLHDVGKVRTPLEVLNKPGKLTPEEFGLMREHARHGRDILMSKRDLYQGAVDVAYGHHERLNGRGYPRGLKAHQIPYFAKVVAIVDTYDAITSSRVYDPGRSPNKAMEILSEGKGTHFDEELVEEFIRWMGIYPPGSLVEMSNGEVGIVTSAEEKTKLRPKVLLVLDSDKKPLDPERNLDLSQIALDSERKPYRILHGLQQGSYGIKLEPYLERGLVHRTPEGQEAPDPE